jgi:hypothetical protein
MGVDIQRTDEGAISFRGLQPDSLPPGGTRLILIVDRRGRRASTSITAIATVLPSLATAKGEAYSHSANDRSGEAYRWALPNKGM